MNNQKVLEKLSEKIGRTKNKEEKNKLEHIRGMLHLMPNVNYEKEFPEIITYLMGTTRLVTSDTIISKLDDWVSKNTSSVESYAIQKINKRARRWLIAFIVIIGLIALAAVVVTMVNLVCGEGVFDGWGARIASALGTLGVALSAVAFIWERLDDMKKKKLHHLGQVTRETGNADMFSIAAVKITKSQIAIGNRNFQWKKCYRPNNKDNKGIIVEPGGTANIEPNQATQEQSKNGE